VSWLAASFSKTRDTSPYQSVQEVRFISCQVVPCPGRRGTSTAYPLSARYSPQGFIEYGDPVKPWLSRTPIERPPVSSGRAEAEYGDACGWTVMDDIVAHNENRRWRTAQVVSRRVPVENG
jgi:hypothetical protein